VRLLVCWSASLVIRSMNGMCVVCVSVCHIKMCVCVCHIKMCVCVSYQNVCVCHIKMCVCHIKMCVCVSYQNVCVCRIKMCVCECHIKMCVCHIKMCVCVCGCVCHIKILGRSFAPLLPPLQANFQRDSHTFTLRSEIRNEKGAF